MVHRDLSAKPVPSDLKDPRESPDLQAPKVLPVLPVQLVPKAQLVKRVQSARKGLQASLALPARKALLA